MIKGGPKIVNDGLVLCLDAHDAKSYAGEPVTNLYGDMSTSSSLRGNRTEYNTGGTWPSDMPMCPEPVGRVYKHTSGALTSSWSGNSYGYMHKDISTTSGLMYTLTFWVYLSPDCDIDYMQSSIEGATSNYGSWTGYPQQYDFTKKGTWQLLSRHATADTSVRFLIYPGHTGVTDGSFSGFFAWGGMQVVQAEYVTPFVLSSRSATNGWVDRSGNSNSGTLTNMIGTGASHYRDGQVIMPVANSYLDFDGSNDYVTLGQSLNNVGNTASIEVWFKSDESIGSSLYAVMFGWGDGTSYYSNFSIGSWFGAWSDESIHLGINSASVILAERNGHSKYHDGNWHHAVATIGVNNYAIYVDGSAVTTSFLYGTQSSSFTNIFNFSASTYSTIGSRPYTIAAGGGGFFNGKIPLVRVYDKILTAAEVLSNYNATKGRFS